MVKVKVGTNAVVLSTNYLDISWIDVGCGGLREEGGGLLEEMLRETLRIGAKDQLWSMSHQSAN